MATLDGHENSCCVLGLPNGTVVTGSSGHQQNNQHVDFQLRIWRDGSVVKTMKDHLGPIKDLSLLSDGAGFVSCSNDGTVRVWDIDGNALDCIGGAHTLFEDGARIAGVTVLPSGEYASVGDDGALTIWDGAESVQRIQHPRGLWAVLALPNGDIVTGGEDYCVRVFSRSPDRCAAELVTQNFHAEVLAAVKASAGGGGGGGGDFGKGDAVDTANMTSASERDQFPGTKDGEIKMFLKGSDPWAYYWDPAGTTWKEIGAVAGAATQTASDGKEYDRTLPIELEGEGGALRTLKVCVCVCVCVRMYVCTCVCVCKEGPRRRESERANPRRCK